MLDYTHGNVIERELLLVKVWTVPKELVTMSTALTPVMAASLQRQTISELARYNQFFKNHEIIQCEYL